MIEKNGKLIIIVMLMLIGLLNLYFVFTQFNVSKEKEAKLKLDYLMYGLNFGIDILRDPPIAVYLNSMPNQIMQKSTSVIKYRFYQSVKDVYGISILSTWELNSPEFKTWISNNSYGLLEPIGNKITLVFPISNGIKNITSVYGARKNVFEENVGGANNSLITHAAIDVGAAMNTKVVSASDGYVIRSSKFKGLGNTVWIYSTFPVVGNKSKSYVFIYGHLNKFIAKQKDRITQGQLIGLTGDSGISTGPHLHFECIALDKEFDNSPAMVKYIEGYYIANRTDLSVDPLSEPFQIQY
jgi:murein DD-endopeptidase MepM/ murein hydrolase activator NlpD